MKEKEEAQRKTYQTHHVIPKPSGEWAIKRGGVVEAIKVFATKRDAVEFAREISRKQGVEIVIHGRDGRLISTHIYSQLKQDEKNPESGFGCARELIFMSPDFDERLEEFNDYI